MRHRENVIEIINENGEIVSQYGVNGGTRGRELAERDVRSGRGEAWFNGVRLEWVRGRYNDEVLDSDVLPDRARALNLL